MKINNQNNNHNSQNPPMPPDTITSFSIEQNFFPSGWLGDGEVGERYVFIDESFRKDHHSEPICYRCEYKPGGTKGWAGVAWQYPDGNWGTEKGRDLTGYKKITFWIKGDKGGEFVTIKTGGYSRAGCRYPSSFVGSLGTIKLKNTWERKELNLQEELTKNGGDLSNVVCAFVWNVSVDVNPTGCIFYLDDIQFEK